MSDAAAGLSADNFDPLNREFYSAKPHEYFVRKLNLLLLYAGRADEVDGLLEDGVTYDRLTLTHDPDKEPAADEIKKSRLEYVTIETEILYHHAIETLLRLYLAHEGHPKCPWLEISRLRNPGHFKAQLQRRLLSDELDTIEKYERLHPILVGVTPETFPGGPERLSLVLRSIEDTMAMFAGDLIDDAARYNASKHGLAIQANEQGMRLGNEEIPEIMSADGPALTYLEIRAATQRTEVGAVRKKKWHRVTAWIDIDARLSAIRIAAYLMEAIWGLGRRAVTGEDKDIQVFLMEQNVDDMVNRKRPWSLAGFAQALLYDDGQGWYEEREAELITKIHTSRCLQS